MRRPRCQRVTSHVYFYIQKKTRDISAATAAGNFQSSTEAVLGKILLVQPRESWSDTDLYTLLFNCIVVKVSILLEHDCWDE